MIIRNLSEANDVLLSFVPPPMAPKAAKFSLDKMRQLMAALDNPQDKFKVVHVAGTSGKTSTSYYAAAFLRAAGKKVGLTISPHVDSVNERVQINLEPLPETEFCSELGKFIDIISMLSIKPSYFEVLVAFAYWEFARSEVDYAVVEVGLGGLLDATNVVSRSNKVCVITDIGLDHTEVLGDTLAKIASQKAGIIQQHNQVYMYQQLDEVMAVVRDVCARQEAPLQAIEPANPDNLPATLPLFLQRNWHLARAVYEALYERDKLTQPTGELLAAAANTYIPARMEAVQWKEKTVVFDGAHNAQKLGVLAESIREKYRDKQIAVLLSLSKGYDLLTTLEQITDIAHHIIITRFSTGQDVPKQPVDPLLIAEGCKKLGFHSVEVVDNPVEAGNTLLTRPEPILLVAGSFYLLNHIRPLVLVQND